MKTARQLTKRPRVLLVGKEARTDALAAACVKSGWEPRIFVFTSFKIPGLIQKAIETDGGFIVADYQLDQSDATRDEILRYADAVKPDLAIIGPEEPLGGGCVDGLEARGIPCFGPRQALARIETSKAWARHLLSKFDIPGNPEHRVFTDSSGLRAYLAELAEFVVKPDVLTGGKGVRVFGEHLHSVAEAYEYALSLIDDSGLVVVEQKLEGEEFSLQTITDGTSWVHCPLVQDHKRAHNGDSGPNTGGMGSYSAPDHGLPFLTQAEVSAAQDTNERVIKALRAETGEPFRGVLYGGYMATRDGIRVIEYNARFGDPEAMNVLPLLETDFVELSYAVGTGTLHEIDVRFRNEATVCKYVVPKGYPDKRDLAADPSISIRTESLPEGSSYYWAACHQVNNHVEMTSSRALALVGIGASIPEAEEIAEDAVKCVKGSVDHRSDIGKKELVQARIDHMRKLRAGTVSSTR